MSLKSVELHPGAGQLIYALANKAGMTLTAALCELIDNALDAGATWIRITYDRQRGTLTIEDNGKGTTDVEAIVTPFKHSSHATTLSGRYGVGGTASQIFLTEGKGSSKVTSITDKFVSKIEADYGEMASSDHFMAHCEKMANQGKPSGTRIILSRCRELTPHEIGSARRELSFTFAPALRKRAKIEFQDGKNLKDWEASKSPALNFRKLFEFEIDGVPVRGFVGLTKPKETNPVRGWAVAHNHRFIGRYTAPLGNRTADLGRIYSEVILGKGWKNINDLKNDFVHDPEELWQKLEEVSAQVLDRADQEGHIFEFDSSQRIAQALLDAMTGFNVKERRASPAPIGEEGKKPTGRNSSRDNASKVQPGDRNLRQPPGLGRIIVTMDSGMGDLIEQIDASKGRIHMSLNRDHPSNQIFKGEAAGPFLSRYVSLAIISDAHYRSSRYQGTLPGFNSEGIAIELGKLLARIRPANPEAA